MLFSLMNLPSRLVLTAKGRKVKKSQAGLKMEKGDTQQRTIQDISASATGKSGLKCKLLPNQFSTPPQWNQLTLQRQLSTCQSFRFISIMLSLQLSFLSGGKHKNKQIFSLHVLSLEWIFCTVSSND